MQDKKYRVIVSDRAKRMLPKPLKKYLQKIFNISTQTHNIV